MATCAVFNYQFDKIMVHALQKELEGMESVLMTADAAFPQRQDIFGDIMIRDFKKAKPEDVIHFKNGHGPKEYIHRHLIPPTDGIFVMRVANRKTQTIVDAELREKRVVNFPVDAAATVGKYTTTITITKVNGNVNEATKNTATGDITTVETLTTWPRNVLIEEFTTEKCVYCPQAASGLANFLKNYPDLAERVAVACHHDGYYTDWLTIPASTSYCWFYNDGNGTYAPAFMYDRYAGDDYTPVVSREANAAGYKKRVEDRLAVDSYANIDLSASFNEDKTQINVTADCERGWDFCSTPSRITLFLTEDNIKARSQAGATGTFTHQHVLRAVNETWGTVLEWNENKASYTYTFTLDEAWKKEDLKVVAFISAYDSTDPTNCTVENTAVAVLAGDDVDGIKDIDNVGETTPAATYYNLAGQKVDKDYKGIVIVNGKKVVRK